MIIIMCDLIDMQVLKFVSEVKSSFKKKWSWLPRIYFPLYHRPQLNKN